MVVIKLIDSSTLLNSIDSTNYSKLSLSSFNEFSNLDTLFEEEQQQTQKSNRNSMDLAFAELNLPMDGLDSFIERATQPQPQPLPEPELKEPESPPLPTLSSLQNRMTMHRASVIEISSILEFVNVFEKNKSTLNVIEDNNMDTSISTTAPPQLPLDTKPPQEDNSSQLPELLKLPTGTPTSTLQTSTLNSPTCPSSPNHVSAPSVDDKVQHSTIKTELSTSPQSASSQAFSNFKYPTNFNMPPLAAPAPLHVPLHMIPTTSPVLSRSSTRESTPESPPSTPKVKHTATSKAAKHTSKPKTSYSTKRAKSPTASSTKRLKDSIHECTHCDKLFLCQSKLRRHLLTHTGDKPHRCYCGQSFSQKSSLKTHSVRHARDRVRDGKHKPEDLINQFSIANLLKPKKSQILAELQSNNTKK